MNPTIGRIVHFTPSEQAARQHGPGPFAAIVTQVHSATCVNLQVFWGYTGLGYGTSVVQDESGKRPLSWRWPPREG